VINLIKRLFEYDNWAIERELNALEDVDNPEALKMLGHVLAAKRIWLVRLNGEDSSTVVTFPDVTLAECRKLAAELAMGFAGQLAALEAGTSAEAITYKNTKGEEFTTPVVDVLAHVAFHGAYHRGQVALFLRQGGDQAVNTDFITFTRVS